MGAPDVGKPCKVQFGETRRDAAPEGTKTMSKTTVAKSAIGRLTFWVGLVALVAGLGLADAAVAQTSPGGGSGAGTGSAPGGPTGSHGGGDIDLPIAKDPTVAEDEIPDPPPEEGDGPTLYDEELPTESESIIYVIDISGSMDWGNSSYTGLDGNPTSGTPLMRAKVELIRSINALTEDYDFNIIAFDCYMLRWKGARQKATAGNKAQAAQWVNGLRAQGATGTGPAGALGLAEKDNKTVVILTDGAPNCGASGFSGHTNMITSANTQGAKVHTFGIGASGSFEQFLRDVAQRNGGRYYPIR